MIKSDKGITLASLVVTIIVLLILASVATVSGLGAVDYIKFNNAKAQFQTMQAQVNSLYEQYKNIEEDEKTNWLNQYGKDLIGIDTTATLGDREEDGYKYFSSDYIKNNLDIDGISYDFLINIQERSVLLFGGIEYQGYTYYSAEDFGINIINYETMSGDITFDKSLEYLDDGTYMVISNISIPENISKYEVYYQKNGDGYWTPLTTDLRDASGAWKIPVKTGETYNIKVTTESDEIVDGEYSREIPTRLVYLAESGTEITENLTLTDINGDKIVVPANFNISTQSPTVVREGMIIEDSQDNQYVWIPIFENTGDHNEWGVDWSAVKTAEKTYNNDKTEANETAYYTAIQKALKTYTATYVQGGFSDVWDEEIYGYYEEGAEESTPYSNGNMTEEEYNILYHSMLNSIYKNGGFYIGRYEMGIAVANNPDEAKSYMRTKNSIEYVASDADETKNEKPTIEGMTLPISKSNAVPYNWITQPQAQMLSVELGKQIDYSNVETSIMFGVQWDVICVFIEKYDTNNTAETKSEWLSTSTYSKLWGNYHDVIFSLDRGYHYVNEWNDSTVSLANVRICTTGAAERNRSLNIYDFAGNVWEYTLENYKYHDGPAVNRGGSFRDKFPASNKATTSSMVREDNKSSRVTFFIK